MMKKIGWILLLLLSGCSGGVRSSLIDLDMRLSSPMLGLNDRVPVVYPHLAGGRNDDPMVAAFGPSWESLESAYPQYRFNP